MQAMTLTVLFLIVVVAAVVIRLLAPRHKPGRVPKSLPVAAKKHFFSRAEREFYETLKRALPAKYTAFANVRLQDIFYISAKGEERRGVYARFQDKHVDFLVVTQKEYRPVLGIELDGASHDRSEQKYRDAVKEVVFTSAGLPLLRFRNEEKWTPDSLRVQLLKALRI